MDVFLIDKSVCFCVTDEILLLLYGAFLLCNFFMMVRGIFVWNTFELWIVHGVVFGGNSVG